MKTSVCEHPSIRSHARPCRVSILVPIVGGLALASCNDRSKKQAGPPPPTSVDVITMHPQSVALETELPGRMEAFLTAEIRPQVSGVVLKRLFTEGTDVVTGQQLYQIDPAPYRATYDTEIAALAKARASEVSAAAKLRRYRPLAQAEAVSRQDYDDATASEGEAVADISSAKASIESARINLAYTKMLSPLSGRIGRSSVTPGALVTANQTTVLATVTQLDPIYVDFTQSSALRLQLQQALASGRLRKDASGGVPIRLILEDGTPYDHLGELQFSEVTVTEATGTFVMRGLVPNPQKLLLPGMFVRGVLQEGINPSAFLVPQIAVSRNTHGDATVFKVGPDNKVKVAIIRTPRTTGGDWIVDKGIKNGDRIVVSGLQMVRPGGSVTPTEQKLGQDADGNPTSTTD